MLRVKGGFYSFKIQNSHVPYQGLLLQGSANNLSLELKRKTCESDWFLICKILKSFDIIRILNHMETTPFSEG